MMFAHVPCIWFNIVADNCPAYFSKQLGLKKSDILVRSIPKKIRPKPLKISRFKGKDWRDHNKYYSSVNETWTNRDNHLVYVTAAEPHNEEPQVVLMIFSVLMNLVPLTRSISSLIWFCGRLTWTQRCLWRHYVSRGSGNNSGFDYFNANVNCLFFLNTNESVFNFI